MDQRNMKVFRTYVLNLLYVLWVLFVGMFHVKHLFDVKMQTGHSYIVLYYI